MLGYIVVNPSAKLTPTQQFFYCIRLGNWNDAFKMLEKDMQLMVQRDDFPSTWGWTVIDHAFGQGRVDIIDTLRNEYQILGRVHPSLMSTFISHQRWSLFFYAIDHQFYPVNAQDTGYTLLDMVNYYEGISYIANILRKNYGAKTSNELEADRISKKAAVEKLPTPKENNIALMFSAAEYDNWPGVFYYLDKGCHVDAQHPSHDGKWVLLQYAFKHKNKEAFLALLKEHHANFDKIQFQSDEEKIEYLIFQFDCLILSTQELPMLEPEISDPETGIRWLYPENDPKEPFKTKTEMRMLSPIGHGRPNKKK